MPVKILTSTLTSLNNFCKNPIEALTKASNGTLAILNNNQPIFYALSIERLTELLTLESVINNPNDGLIYKNILQNIPSHIKKHVGKFAMHIDWNPGMDFQRQAAVWGISLSKKVTDSELATFIAYWKAEGCLFHHVQWQQKLARSLQIYRSKKNLQIKNDLTQYFNLDRSIPDGFRGK